MYPSTLLRGEKIALLHFSEHLLGGVPHKDVKSKWMNEGEGAPKLVLKFRQLKGQLFAKNSTSPPGPMAD